MTQTPEEKRIYNNEWMKRRRRANRIAKGMTPPILNAITAALAETWELCCKDENVAPYPVAIAYNNREWTVDLMIRDKEGHEYDTTAIHPLLDRALAIACWDLQQGFRNATEEATYTDRTSRSSSEEGKEP